jgi:hypothetical protein
MLSKVEARKKISEESGRDGNTWPSKFLKNVLKFYS